MPKKHLHTHLVLLLLCAFATLVANAQEPAFRHFSVSDGLPSSEVYDVLQDNSGRMWFATDRGAARFDGTNFETFTEADGMADYVNYVLTKDEQGRIWFGGNSSRITWYDSTGFHKHPANEALAALSFRQIIGSLAMGPNDTLWIGLRRGVTKGAIMGVAFDGSLVTNDWQNKPYAELQLRTFSNGTSVYGLWQENNPPRNQLQVTDPDGRLRPPVWISDNVRHSYALLGHDGAIYASANDHVYRLDGDTLEEVGSYAPEAPTNSLSLDSKGNLWQGTYSGAWQFSNSSPRVARQFCKGRAVSRIFEDREGGIWMTTLDDGVYYYPDVDVQSWTNYSSPGVSRVMHIASADYGLYVSVYNDGIWRYKSPVTPNSKAEVEALSGRHMYMAGSVDGTIAYRALPFVGPIGLPTLRPESEVPALDSWGYATASLSDSLTALLYGERLMVYNRFTQEISHDQLHGSHLLAVAASASGQQLVGGYAGAFELVGNALVSLADRDSLLGIRINDIVPLRDGFALATLGAGVLLMHGDSIVQISTAEGLSSDLCNKLDLDHLGNLWVATNHGLCAIAKPGLKGQYIRNFNESHGLLTAEINSVVLHDSMVFAATNSGLTMLNPNNLSPNPIKPFAHLTSLKVNGMDTALLNGMELRHGQNNIALAFTGCTFKDTEKQQYKYRLRGGDEQWTVTSESRVSFPILPAGAYQFEVFAANNDGVWSASPATFAFSVLPPWWSTWWFRSLMALLLVSMMWIIFVVRERQLVHQQQLATATVESELKALRSQITPHFIFNALNTIMGLIAGKRNKQALDGLSRFAKLMRKTLRHSESPSISLAEEIDSLTLYLQIEALRFSDGFRYEIEVGDDIDQEFTSVPPMLLQPFVENAIWHGLRHKETGDKIVRVTFQQQNDQLLCKVSDNGIGRAAAGLIAKKEARLDKSRGLENIEQRLQLLRQSHKKSFDLSISDLTNDAGEAVGTQIMLAFPLT